ncbi:hypothetical protein BDR26DRAFT_861919 [Obelidium mucronatum]|nr:hypothetical protein BDR26DRAFT_861919 [Obelidium mucronatum]
MRPLPCIRCRYYRRKCSLDRPECDRCARLGFECEYPKRLVKGKYVTVSPSPAASTLSVSSSSTLEVPEEETPSIQSQVPSVLGFLINTSEQSLEELEDCKWEIEDPDLMPTLEDFAIVYNFNTKGGSITPICCFSYDNDHFLRTFFHQPPVLRMIYCAMAAYTTTPILPESIQLSYYARARKALVRAMSDKPTHQTVQALLNVCLFAFWKGQPDIGAPFFKMALSLISMLKLDIDPDDSPWLFNLKLSPRQKEDRRRAFWACYWYLCFQQSVAKVTDSIISISLNHAKIKPPSGVDDPYPIFASMPVILPGCEIYRLITAIKQAAAVAPESIHDLAFSKKTLSLHSRLIAAHSMLPSQYLMISESPTELTASDHARFKAQNANFSIAEHQGVPSLNLYTFASVSILNRPILYLTSIPSFQPINQTSEMQTLVASAIRQCLDSAFRTACFLQYYLQDETRQDYIMFHTDIHPMFEAMVVFWFVSCRMEPVWWALVPEWKDLVSWSAVGRHVLDLVAFAKRVFEREGKRAGCSMPILTCMEAMWREMEIYQAHGCFCGGSAMFRNTQVSKTNNDVDDIVLGMRVSSLNDMVDDDDENENDYGYIVKEPQCFLGLLGMDVCSGISWMGPSEESWRLFWKLYS